MISGLLCHTQGKCTCVQDTCESAAAGNAQNELAAARAAYLAEAQQRFVLPAAQQQEFRQTVMYTFQAACQQLEHDHDGLIEADKENSRVLNNRQVLLLVCTACEPAVVV